MDERKNTIKALEEKKRTLTEARNQLFTDLGENLFQRIGEEEPFIENTSDKPGGILADYRKLQNEIAESADKIKTLEADAERLKVLEEEFADKENEKFRLASELEDAHIRLGKALLAAPDFEEIAGPSKAQEENYLVKIEEQEKKQEELEERDGNIFAWVGKNAQMAVSKNLLSKHRSALKRVYLNAGEKILSSGQAESLDKEAAEEAQKLSESLSSLTEALAALKVERKKITDSFGSTGTPSKRIHGLEKHITHVKGELPGVYLRLGSLLDGEDGRDALSSFLKEEDKPVLEKAELHKTQIAEGESEVKKIKAAINIDKEKAEIEKTKKSILNQKQKISAAESQISDYEKQIVESKDRIEELEALIKGL